MLSLSSLGHWSFRAQLAGAAGAKQGSGGGL